MKTTIMTVSCLLIALCTAHAQKDMDTGTCMMDFDITTLLKNGSVRIGADCRINSNWSAGGHIQCKAASRKPGKEESGHMKEFSEPVPTEADSGKDRRRRSAGVHARFWPVKTYKGMYISIGVGILEERHTDCTVGIGYCMNIWRMFSATASVEIDMIDSCRRQKFTGNGIGIRLCVIF